MKISIITVCYNSAPVIRTAMESVLRQTWKDTEYLVIDGGSTDGTVEIIRECEAKFGGRMRWVSEPDRGMYDAINKGLSLASGEVVGLLNADDVLSDDRVIERVAEEFGIVSGEQLTVNRESGDDRQQFTAHGLRNAGVPDALYGDIRFVANRQGVGLAEIRREKTVRYYSAKYWKPWMLQWGFMPPHPSVYIRRSCFEKLGNYSLGYKIAADYALLVRFLRRAQLPARYVPMCFVTMRVGGVSTKDWKSNLLLNREIVRGNREAGYFCCLPMLLPKYAFKIWEFVGPRIFNSAHRDTKSTEEKKKTDSEGSVPL